MARNSLLVVFAVGAAFVVGAAIGPKLLRTDAHAKSIKVADNQGLSYQSSPHSVDVTVERLTKALKAKGLTVFTVIDHAAGAKKAGLELPATKVVVFGNPKIGTPLMAKKRTVGIDLPMKMLVWSADGKTQLAYNTADYMAKRHMLTGMPQWNKVKGALAAFAKAATTK